ncbi:MAG: hypothetical protein LBG28_00420 [Tannerella sp.]|jgi:hypothetical protein|nr:hypothetical protein [Tannerella sp.]
MKRLFTLLSVTMIVNFAISSIVSAEERVSAKTSEQDGKKKEDVASTVKTVREYVKTEISNIFSDASKEYKREISKEFKVSSSPTLSISNEFGNIRVVEGDVPEIIFKIAITGKGKNEEAARKYAESVDVEFKQNGNSISAQTIFEKIQCRNCGRNVDYEVTVPKDTRQVLQNKFGHINVHNTGEPLEVRLEFGNLYANEISEADINIQYGEATINKCGNMKIKSSFSKYKLGEIGSLSGSISYDGFDIEELGRVDVVSDFSNVDIENLKDSFSASKFTYGSLKIGAIDNHFSKIKVTASFSKIKIALTDKHNFKVTLYNSFGSIKTGDIVFYEKSMDKKDVIVGVAGKIKDPLATVDISNEFGSIVLQ